MLKKKFFEVFRWTKKFCESFSIWKSEIVKLNCWQIKIDVFIQFFRFFNGSIRGFINKVLTKAQKKEPLLQSLPRTRVKRNRPGKK